MIALVTVSSVACGVFTALNTSNRLDRGGDFALISVATSLLIFFQLLHVVVGTFYNNVYEIIGMLCAQAFLTIIVVIRVFPLNRASRRLVSLVPLDGMASGQHGDQSALRARGPLSAALCRARLSALQRVLVEVLSLGWQ